MNSATACKGVFQSSPWPPSHIPHNSAWVIIRKCYSPAWNISVSLNNPHDKNLTLELPRTCSLVAVQMSSPFSSTLGCAFPCYLCIENHTALAAWNECHIHLIPYARVQNIFPCPSCSFNEERNIASKCHQWDFLLIFFDLTQILSPSRIT